MVQVIPGAEPWSAGDGDLGALLLHGFTGNPVSLRPLARDLADAGLAVELPRLPGHGTHWRDLARTTARDWLREARRGLDALGDRTTQRIVVGSSMGGALALELAARRPDDVHGLVLINPWIRTRDPRARYLPLLKHVLRSIPGVGNDIALPGADEQAYPTVPTKAVHWVVKLQRRLDLAAVKAPLLLLTSPKDHTVSPEDSRLVLEGVGSQERRQVLLRHSFHVATLDHDAPLITKLTLEFAYGVAEGREGEGEAGDA